MNKAIKGLFRNLRWAVSFSSQRWRYLFSALSLKEKRSLAALMLLAAVASFSLAGWEYWVVRTPSAASGGSYIEGIVGEPRYLNPVLGTTNETDRDIITLLFALLG